jgi:hypothetical protein
MGDLGGLAAPARAEAFTELSFVIRPPPPMFRTPQRD